MNPKAVIYCSKHGTSKMIAYKYAKQYGLPCIDIQNIRGFSFQGVPVIFCSWIRNGNIQELAKAKSLFMCFEIVTVGCLPSNETYRLELMHRNGIANSIFTYIQSSARIHLNLFEKIYVSIIQPSLLTWLNRKEVVLKHEYTI